MSDKQELEAIHERAMAIYETVREKLEAEAWGDYFVVDIDNGEYRTTPDDYIPTADKLSEQYPEDRIHIMRVGLLSAGHVGGGFRPRGGLRLIPDLIK